MPQRLSPDLTLAGSPRPSSFPDKHLADGRTFIAGEYSSADMACYPWVVPHERQLQRLEEFPALEKWFARVRGRPATVRAYARAKEVDTAPVVSGRSALGALRPGCDHRALKRMWQYAPTTSKERR